MANRTIPIDSITEILTPAGEVLAQLNDALTNAEEAVDALKSARATVADIVNDDVRDAVRSDMDALVGAAKKFQRLLDAAHAKLDKLIAPSPDADTIADVRYHELHEEGRI